MTKYERWYFNLMDKAAKRAWTKSSAPRYVERHHITPRSLGGTDDSGNLVVLTAKEHYIAHRLLCRFGNSNQRQHMVFAMQRFLYSMKDRSHVTPRAYEYLRRVVAEAKSSAMVNNTRRLGIPHTDEIKQKMSQHRKGVRKPESTKAKMSESAKQSWVNRPVVSCPHCGKSSRNKSNMTRWHFSNCKEYHAG